MRTRWFENTLGDERLRPVAHAVTPWASARTLFSCASAARSRPGPQVSGRRPSGRALPGRGTARGAVAPPFAAQAARPAVAGVRAPGAVRRRCCRAGSGCGAGQCGGGSPRGLLKRK